MRDGTLLHLLVRLVHVGWCAAASSLACANMRDGTLLHLLLHLPTCGTVRCCIFSCTFQHVVSYAGTFDRGLTWRPWELWLDFIYLTLLWWLLTLPGLFVFLSGPKPQRIGRVVECQLINVVLWFV